ncbi:hypothetical protein GCM10023210_33410 [Chryseobacterium ginsengisoli]|uniref:HTH araC/xylS-type domain-containing protein n=2 Tax=Chryseobacterium ginsengisoli TaxID=363853 RepID=A0ABP9MKI6_9FLAO
MINDIKPNNNSVDSLKRKLIEKYIYFMSATLFGYSTIFYFLFEDSLFAISTLTYSILMLHVFLIIRKNYNINTLIHLYLTYAPLFAAYIMLDFWKYSAATCMWLLPVPIGAYVFLSKKFVYIYSAYILLIIILVNILTKYYDFNYFSFKDVKYMVISDTFVGLINISVVALLLYYNEKIRKIEIEESFKNTMNPLANLEDQEQKMDDEDTVIDIEDPEEAKNFENSESLEKYIAIFDDIKKVVEKDEYFKNVDFTISELSNILKVNNLYLSKSIKTNGYSNFNHYLNTCRIENVKKLIQENDINKITLMYIYTAAGFSNQSTFNRVFKQIEGITPSEYINSQPKEN